MGPQGGAAGSFARGPSYVGGQSPAVFRAEQGLMSSCPLPQAVLAAADLTHRRQDSLGYPQEHWGKRAFGVGTEICRVIGNVHWLVVTQHRWARGERLGA